MMDFQSEFKRLKNSRILQPLLILALLLIFDGIFIKGFFSIEIRNGNLYGRLIDIINRSAPLIILAIGMTMVIATKGIDISVGAVVAISGAIVAQLLGPNLTPQTPFIICILLALIASILCGSLNGFLVANLGISPIVTTLILMVAGRGIAQLITSGQIPTIQYKPFTYVASFAPGIPIPLPIIIVAVILFVALFFTKRTSFGIFLEAIGINPEASKYTGINVNKIIFLTYAFSGFCAGVAGLIISSQIKAADANNAGLLIEMDAILAVALGGTQLSGGKFDIWASVVGAIIIQTLTTTLYALGVSPEVLPVIKALVIIIICLIQSDEFHRFILNGFAAKRRVQNDKVEAKF